MKKLKCHCGGVEAEIALKTDIQNLVRCNCSLCKKKGAIMMLLGPNQFKIIKGEKLLTLYQFHSKVAKHFFCSICGIYTHHNPRKDPGMTGFNIACLEGINPFACDNIKILDGANHPLDKNK